MISTKSPRAKAPPKRGPAELDLRFFHKRPSLVNKRIINSTNDGYNVIKACMRCSARSVDACTCFTHRCGYTFTITPVTVLQRDILGRCKKQECCASCCRHRACDSCRAIYDATRNKRCIGCGMCPSHCKCRPCDECSELFSPDHHGKCMCGQGTHHAHCCDSPEQIEAVGSSILWRKRKLTFFPGQPCAETRIKRFMSIECEVSHRGKIEGGADRVRALYRAFNNNARLWRQSVVEEGSCPSGWEINMSPATGDQFVKQVHDTISANRSLSAETGVRAGMHVHIDARDITYQHLENLIEIYCRVEPALYAMLPPWRRINRFCVPSGDYYKKVLLTGLEKGRFSLVTGPVQENVRRREPTSTLLAAGIFNDDPVPSKKPTAATVRTETRLKSALAVNLCNNMYGAMSMQEHRKIHKNGRNQHLRYMSLNLHSWVYQHTVEFRHAAGSLDVQQMLYWPQVCAAIVEQATRMPLKAIAKLPSDPLNALLAITEPSSWMTSGVHKYILAMIAKWSPDYAYIKHANNACPIWVNPEGNYRQGFDMTNMLYTILPTRGATWECQWRDLLPWPPDNAWYATPADVEPKMKGAFAFLANDHHPAHIYKAKAKAVSVPVPPDEDDSFIDSYDDRDYDSEDVADNDRD